MSRDTNAVRKKVSLGQCVEVHQRGAAVGQGRSGRFRAGPQQQRVSPDTVRQATRSCKVAANSRSCGRLFSTSEVDGVRPALEKAKKFWIKPKVEVQITECKSFIAWAKISDLRSNSDSCHFTFLMGKVKVLWSWTVSRSSTVFMDFATRIIRRPWPVHGRITETFVGSELRASCSRQATFGQKSGGIDGGC